MKASVFACGLCCLLCGLPCGAQAQAQDRVSSVVIRVLDGHNGRPVKRANLTVTQTPAQPYATPLDRRADRAGRTSLLLQSGTELHTVVLHHPTCRTVKKADRAKPPIGYATDEVLRQGMVSENDCSQRTVAPTPGELTLFVRRQHWWERMSY